MEIFVRLFVWILNLVYGRGGSNVVVGQDPMDKVVERQYDEERKSKRRDQIVEGFKSSTDRVHGAVDYDELKWDSFKKAIETPEQFVFYDGHSVQKIIRKSEFSSRQETVTLRRVIRRYLSDCDLRDD
jgi:hypothetical protein